MDQKKTGYFLKQLRNEKKLTQEQLAEKFQITSRTVSRWETGSNMPLSGAGIAIMLWAGRKSTERLHNFGWTA